MIFVIIFEANTNYVTHNAKDQLQPEPSVLPDEVTSSRWPAAMTDFEGSGLSIAEISHRSKEFTAVIEEGESLVRELLSVPDDYSVLFLQGGASLQFLMVPMNLMKTDGMPLTWIRAPGV